VCCLSWRQTAHQPGNIISETIDTLERWEQHSEAVNSNNVHLENHIHAYEAFEENVELSADELDTELVFKELKKYRAPRVDGLPSE
jgi:hypothetical protein